MSPPATRLMIVKGAGLATLRAGQLNRVVVRQVNVHFPLLDVQFVPFQPPRLPSPRICE